MPSTLDDRRAALGLTIDKLAKRAGLGRTTVIEVVSGKRPNPHNRTVHRIAEALGMTAAEVRAALAPQAVQA